MELTEEQRRAARDLRDIANMAQAQADQLVHAGTREDALGVLLALIGQGGTIRDGAADLYVRLIGEGEEG